MATDYQTEAEQAVKDTAGISDFSYRGNLPLGETWALAFSKNRDSGTLEKSNFSVIEKDLKKRFPKSVQVVRSSHWGVGWVEQIAVKMLDNKGNVTKAGIAALDWNNALASYPVASDTAFSEAEHEETLDNIESEAPWGDYDTQHNRAIAGDLLAWLEENDQDVLQSEAGDAPYPKREELAEAFEGLGYLLVDVAEGGPGFYVTRAKMSGDERIAYAGPFADLEDAIPDAEAELDSKFKPIEIVKAKDAKNAEKVSPWWRNGNEMEAVDPRQMKFAGVAEKRRR